MTFERALYTPLASKRGTSLLECRRHIETRPLKLGAIPQKIKAIRSRTSRLLKTLTLEPLNLIYCGRYPEHKKRPWLLKGIKAATSGFFEQNQKSLCMFEVKNKHQIINYWHKCSAFIINLIPDWENVTKFELKLKRLIFMVVRCFFLTWKSLKITKSSFQLQFITCKVRIFSCDISKDRDACDIFLRFTIRRIASVLLYLKSHEKH